MNLDQARFNMVEQQIRPWDVLDPKILDLLMEIPRHQFVAESQQTLAYSDIELPIGQNQTMWFPKVEGRILQAIEIDPSESVLEVGTGSGYLTALMARLAKHVTSVELYEDLLDIAKIRLSHFDNISFHAGDASQDWPDGQTYDVIVLSGAVAEIPKTYLTKLNLGGRLALIAGQAPAMVAQVITRISDEEWETETLFETVAPNLVHAEAKEKFAF